MNNKTFDIDLAEKHKFENRGKEKLPKCKVCGKEQDCNFDYGGYVSFYCKNCDKKKRLITTVIVVGIPLLIFFIFVAIKVKYVVVF